MKRSTTRTTAISALCLLGLCLFPIIPTASLLTAVAANEHPTRTLANSEVSLEVVQSRGFPDESEDYYIVKGILKNTGARNATNIYVKAEIFWDTGIKRGEATRQADINILRPGETSPFEVWVSYVVPNLIDYYTLDVAGVETTKQPYRATTITQHHLVVRDQYRYVYGEIINPGPRTVDGDDLSVYTVFFDSHGRLLDRDYYNIGHSLAPSWKSPFRARTSLFNQVESYEFWIQADVFEEGVYPVELSATITETEPFLLSSLIVTGTITNNSDVSAAGGLAWGRLVFVYRDSQARVEDFESSLLIADIGPGETQLFSDLLWPPDDYTDLQPYAFAPATTTMIPPSIIRTLDVITLGEGHVHIDPARATYIYGDVVTLTATPGPGWSFARWTGDLETTDNPLELVLQADTLITATFTEHDYSIVYLPLVLANQ